MLYVDHDSIDSQVDVPGWSGFARFVNHSHQNANLRPQKLIDSQGFPHIVMYASCAIRDGDELLFDYGDRPREPDVNIGRPVAFGLDVLRACLPMV